MGLFKRKRSDDDLPAGPDYRSPVLGLRAGDLQVLAALTDAGANLDEPRHARHFLYFPNEAAAVAASEDAAERGFQGEVTPPHSDDDTEWSLVCERHGVVLHADTVRTTSDFFEAVAQAHQGEYDGWEASV